MIIVPTEKRLDWRTTPVVLISILIINILVFIVYQSGDHQKAFDATSELEASGYIEHEWPIYEQYLESEVHREEDLEWARHAYDDGDD